MSTKIEWTQIPGTTGETWNPIRARNLENGKLGHFCEKISPGCKNCYASTWNARGMDVSANGLVYIAENRDKAEFFLDEKRLLEPLSWRKPRSVFLESMSDLFGSWVPDEWIDRIFAVMAFCPQHTFIVLTKRAARMRQYCYFRNEDHGRQAIRQIVPWTKWWRGWKWPYDGPMPWPLPNVWLGVSVEDQQRADERIPELLNTPATVRFISYEPALGPVDWYRGGFSLLNPNGPPGSKYRDTKIDWLIIGGESGHEARPFNVAWARQAIRDCREAGVKVFMKQLGAKPERCMSINAALDLERFAGTPIDRTYPMKLTDKKKGGEPSEWPEDLRVREWPEVRR